MLGPRNRCVARMAQEKLLGARREPPPTGRDDGPAPHAGRQFSSSQGPSQK